ncbi:MAG TPA: recombination mediator RecR, partial [Bdellovibrionales bacterium]|nr:recombination mediator RecR [Bdellovibrionales bacterium]
MAFQIEVLDRLVGELTKLPGVGEKTAQRLALYILKSGHEYSQALREALQDVELTVHNCKNCYAYTDQAELCRICQDPNRDESLICVVEEAPDVMRVENVGSFKGRYHVLQGAISPLEGVGPDDLRINELMERIERGERGEGPAVREIVLVLDADLEGDTTALYLAKLIHGGGDLAPRR